MHALRVLFVLALGAVGWSLASDPRIATGPLGGQGSLIVAGFLVAAVVVVALDVFFIPRKSLAAISGLFFGLIVGMVVAFGLSLIIDLLESAFVPRDPTDSQESFVSAVKLAIGVICCYLAVSFVLQTKDDVRFVIPYVEFAKDTKGGRPFVLDTSVIIDGRIADVANTRILEAELNAAEIPARAYGKRDSNHSRLNNDLGKPDDPATEEFYKFLDPLVAR